MHGPHPQLHPAYMLDHVGKARGKTRDWSEEKEQTTGNRAGMGTTAIVQGSADKREQSWRSKSERERSAKEQNREVA